MSASLAARLREAAKFLADDIPPGTPEIQDLDGDVRLDALDFYCVNLMREAADGLAALEAKLLIAQTHSMHQHAQLEQERSRALKAEAERGEPIEALKDILSLIHSVCPEYDEATVCANARATIARAEGGAP